MKTRHAQQKILIQSDREAIFNALVKPSWIKKWWLASSAIVIPQTGGIYAVCWGDDPDEPDYTTVARIKEISAPEKLVLSYESYLTNTGKLPFESDFEVEFLLTTIGGKCQLVVKQTGFPIDPIADEYFEGCVQGWKDTLKWIKFAIENQ